MGLLYGEDRKADALLCPDPQLTSMLFTAHGDIHWRDDFGHTPLTFAAHIGFAAGVRWLIEQRAEVSGIAADGRTVLSQWYKRFMRNSLSPAHDIATNNCMICFLW